VIVREGDSYFLQGPVTIDTVQSALVEGRQLFEGPQVRVDLSRVSDVDSAAVSLLLEWVRNVAGRGWTMHYSHFNRNLKSLAVLYGVTHLIPGVDD
jgi:phospholipid transport system transporter-binding protein